MLTTLCAKVQHLEDQLYKTTWATLKQLRKFAIDHRDMVMYEEVVYSMVRMMRNHKAGHQLDRLQSAEDVFGNMKPLQQDRSTCLDWFI